MTNPEHVLERYVADLQKFGTSTDKEEIVLYAARRIKDLEQQLEKNSELLLEYRKLAVPRAAYIVLTSQLADLRATCEHQQEIINSFDLADKARREEQDSGG